MRINHLILALTIFWGMNVWAKAEEKNGTGPNGGIPVVGVDKPAGTDKPAAGDKKPQ